MWLLWVSYLAPHVCRRAVVRMFTTPQCLLLGLVLSASIEVGVVLLLAHKGVFS